MSLTGAIVALAVGVMLPILLSTSVGIVAITLGDTSEDTVIGVLVISFAAAAIGSAVVVVVLLGRRARISRLQADFTANITHDLRTPLSAIRMYAQTLQMGRLKNDPQRVAEALDTIVRETEWLGTMIDRVIMWRAAAKDRDAPEMIYDTLENAVGSAVDRFKKMVVPGEVNLDASLSSNTVVQHDKHVIASLTLNLLINAYKYTGPQKTISVTLTDTKNAVELSVTDNGIGIAQNELNKVFEPFYRVDSRLRGKSTGAGLGLAIVQHQVKVHKGNIFVESELNKGSSFTVVLPKSSDSEDKKEAQA